MALSAVRVIIVAHVLVCIIAVIIVPMRTYHRIEKCEYASNDTVFAIISTLSFIYARPKKRSQNQIRNFATFIIFSDFEKMIVAIHPIHIIGNANASISTLNQKNVTSHGVSVVPIFAPITTHKAFDKPITHAHTNQSVIIVTIVLL